MTIDSTVVDIDGSVPIDVAELPDTSVPLDGPAPDQFIQVGLPQLQIVLGSGIMRVEGGGRTLNALFGQPIVRTITIPGGHQLEPGLMPQTRAP